MRFNVVSAVGRPVPPNVTRRQVILAALADGAALPIDESDSEMRSAAAILVLEGIIVRGDDGRFRLVPGAGDAASAARIAMRASRAARAVWGREMQDVLRARREAR